MPPFLVPPAYHSLTLKDHSEIAYLDEGPKDGPVILFLHGLGDSAQVWMLTVTALRHKYRCLAVDLPGHGQTTVPDFNFRMFDFGEFVLDFLTRLKVKTFSLAGHSMGGQIGIILALRVPALLEKLVLVAPAGFETFTKSEMKMLQAGFTFQQQWHTATGDLATKLKPDRQTGLQLSMASMLAEPVFSFLPRLQLPTLVVFGRQDGFIPNRFLHPLTTDQVARAGASQIPDSELHLFDRCGHYPQNEQPKLFQEVLLHFLRKK